MNKPLISSPAPTCATVYHDGVLYSVPYTYQLGVFFMDSEEYVTEERAVMILN